MLTTNGPDQTKPKPGGTGAGGWALIGWERKGRTSHSFEDGSTEISH